MRRNTHGFTIVELLVVIIVIGILASISIVAYNGIQDRANLARTLVNVSNYEKFFQVYSTSSGKYLPSGSWIHTCLGTVDDYPAGDGFEAGECVAGPYNWGDWGSRSIDTSFAQALTDTEGILPSGSAQTAVDNNGKRYRGLVYTASEYSSSYYSESGASIWYWIKGEHDTCPKGKRVEWGDPGSGVTACVITFDPKGTGYEYFGNYGGEL